MSKSTTINYVAIIAEYEEVETFKPLKKKNKGNTKEWTSQEKAKMSHRKGRSKKFKILSY